MAQHKINDGTPITVTISLNSIAAAAARQSAVVDLGADRALGYWIELRTKMNASPSSGSIALYAAPTRDASVFDGGASGSDAAFGASAADIAARTALMRPIGALAALANTDAQSKTWRLSPITRKFALVVVNGTNQALSGTAGDHVVVITPDTETIV